MKATYKWIISNLETVYIEDENGDRNAFIYNSETGERINYLLIEGVTYPTGAPNEQQIMANVKKMTLSVYEEQFQQVKELVEQYDTTGTLQLLDVSYYYTLSQDECSAMSDIQCHGYNETWTAEANSGDETSVELTVNKDPRTKEVNYLFDFTIKDGSDGKDADISVGTVTVSDDDPSQPASVDITMDGTLGNKTMNFNFNNIKGEKGDQGIQGI